MVRFIPEVESFNDAGAFCESTAYGTLKTRMLSIKFDIRGLEADRLSLAEMHLMLLDQFGFDLNDSINMQIEPSIRRISFWQKWWDRSERKPVVGPTPNEMPAPSNGLRCVSVQARRRWFLFGPWVVKAKYRVIQ